MSEESAKNIETKEGLPVWVNIIAAFLGLFLLSPLLLLVSVLIKLTSKGPIFFKQKRVGLNGKEFVLFKFRTMKADNDGPKITTKNDVRITPIGKILRKSKLDEFPQLINVLKGEMALVGPRPEVKEYVELNPDLWKVILKVRPGITDPVTLKLRNEEELLQKAESPEEFYSKYLSKYKADGYLDYIKKRGIFYDVKIITRTLLGVIFPKLNPPPDIDEIYEGWKNG
ncbi:MAG: sugar transferase [Thermoanaerobaculaceae bacterium]|nr:sugar transferase [Thermoanaerobaculaceae bacterium]